MKLDRTNTILYCSTWDETVDFYRDVIGLETSFENDWFVEFALGPGAFLSIADTARATIPSAHGAGITLGWQVTDLDVERTRLVDRGVACTPIAQRWGARTTYLLDPEGNRIELWSPLD
ncbi:VOC family protein [Ilumatobacter sp.]|uniref:VOC family protein n=1 Tax=Ilumatobacter sp. TaxID=1967498 RepID=UPI003C3921DA